MTPSTPEETLMEAGTALTEVTQNNQLYNSLTNFKCLQQLADICGNKLPRVMDPDMPTGDKTDISALRVSQHQPSQPPLHCYPTQAKALNVLLASSHAPLPTNLIDALDVADPDQVSNAHINAVICP